MAGVQCITTVVVVILPVKNQLIILMCLSLAVLFGLKALCSTYSYTHIKILADNSTAVHTINNMGSCRSIQCDNAERHLELGHCQ